MLKDLDLNVKELNIRNLDNGVLFTSEYITNPIDDREIPMVLGVTIPGHERFKDSPVQKPVRMFVTARHAQGIYFGFPLDHSLDLFTDLKIKKDIIDFDLKNGMWYTMDDMRESFQRESWSDDRPLECGKPRPNHAHIANSYGLADDITQILKRYRAVVTNTNYNVVLHISVHKAGYYNGMRWHKQGKYLGTFKKKCEYMDDEVGLGDILSFHFYVIGE